MIVSIFALILLYQIAKYITFKIKEIKTDNSNENEYNYWMFTYDFKKEKKKSIFDKESQEITNTKRKKNNLIVLLYLTYVAIFIYINYFVSKMLVFILK